MADDIIDKLSRPAKECWDCVEWFCDHGVRRPCDCHDWDDIHADAKAEIERLRQEIAKLRYIQSFNNVDIKVYGSHMRQLKPLLDEVLEALDDFRCDCAWEQNHEDLTERVAEIRKSWWPQV